MDAMKTQAALVARGYNIGSTGPQKNGIDGAWGRRSIEALKAFQAASRLEATGVLDSRTFEALFPATKPPAIMVPPWFSELGRLRGLNEVRDGSVIVGWAKALGGWIAKSFTNAHTEAWCGLAAAHVVSMTLPSEPLPNNPLGARNWLNFGVSCVPQVGAVLVFWRGSKSGWLGHVGFYVSETADAYIVLAGNQRDTVCEVPIAKGRLLGARWPRSYPLPTSPAQVFGSSSPGKFSTNES